MLKKITFFALITYFTIGIGLFLLQDFLLFPVLLLQVAGRSFTAPPPPGVSSLTLTTNDGKSLEGWTTYSPERFPNPKFVAIVFHGNGETIHTGNFLPFFARKGVPAFSFDYRGYGNSTGWPSEQKLYTDASEIWKKVQETSGLPSSQLLILGNSLGTGVATSLARKVSPRALFLIAPYASLTEVINSDRIYSLFSWALRYELPVSEDLSHTSTDYLVVAHGEKDEVIPFRQFYTVTKAAHHTGIKKIIPLVSSSATHNDIYYKVESELDAALTEIVS